jgi:hypothetical protein
MNVSRRDFIALASGLLVPDVRRVYSFPTTVRISTPVLVISGNFSPFVCKHALDKILARYVMGWSVE